MIDRREFVTGLLAAPIAATAAFQTLLNDFIYLTPTGGDDTAMINAAIERCMPGGTVMLAPGVFRLGATVVFGTDGVTLKGSTSEDGEPLSELEGELVIKAMEPGITATLANLCFRGSLTAT